MSRFKGEYAAVLNAIDSAIQGVRLQGAKYSGTNCAPQLLAYLGREQISAVHRLSPLDLCAAEKGRFLDAKVVEVNESSYLHIAVVRGVAVVELTPAELQSGSTRVDWAEGLIRQLPEDHDGRNSWLLNYGVQGE